MSEEERNEYMNHVRWKTAGYIAFALAGLLISGTGGVFIIKGDVSKLSDNIALYKAETKRDINDLRLENKEDNKELRHYVDSQFHDIFNAINNKNLVPSKRILHLQGDGCVIQKIVNGKREYVPIDCDFNQAK